MRQGNKIVLNKKNVDVLLNMNTNEQINNKRNQQHGKPKSTKKNLKEGRRKQFLKQIDNFTDKTFGILKIGYHLFLLWK